MQHGPVQRPAAARGLIPHEVQVLPPRRRWKIYGTSMEILENHHLLAGRLGTITSFTGNWTMLTQQVTQWENQKSELEHPCFERKSHWWPKVSRLGCYTNATSHTCLLTRAQRNIKVITSQLLMGQNPRPYPRISG